MNAAVCRDWYRTVVTAVAARTPYRLDVDGVSDARAAGTDRARAPLDELGTGASVRDGRRRTHPRRGRSGVKFTESGEVEMVEQATRRIDEAAA